MSEPVGFSLQSFGQIVEVVLEHGFEAPLYLTCPLTRDRGQVGTLIPPVGAGK